MKLDKRLAQLEKELAEAREQIEVIKYENKELKKTNNQLENEIQHQVIVGQTLTDDIYQLKKQIAKHPHQETEKAPEEEKITTTKNTSDGFEVIE